MQTEHLLVWQFFARAIPRFGLSLSRAENYNINERLVCKKGTDLDFMIYKPWQGL